MLFDLGDGCFGSLFVVDVVAVEFFAVQMGQACRHGSTVLCREGGRDGPVFLRIENLDLGFAFADQAQGDRLHASRRFRSRQFAPQDWRQAEPDQIVERAAGEIGVDQLAVQFARVVYRLDNGVLGDFVENDAFDNDIVQGTALGQDFLQMP